MAREFSFEFTAHSAADVSTLFALAADGGHYSQWAGLLIPRSSWERQGDPPPGGVGAIRRLGLWPVVFREETVAYEQDRLYAYVIRSASPMRDYRAELTFAPNGDGSDVAVRARFEERVPGTGALVALVMKGILRSLTARMVRAAARRS
jgi:hypothetical protein